MKLCRRFCFLLCIAGVRWSGAGADAAPTELVGTAGETVTFPLEIPAGETLDNVGWTIGTESLAIAVPGDPASVVVSNRRYRGRLRVPNAGLALHITDLRPEDAGSYTARVTTDKSEFTRLFTLRVYERLPQPMIHCNAQSCTNGLCNITLSCTIPNGGSKVTYSWSIPQPPSMTSQGSIAVISHPDLLINITCTVQNPASNSSTIASVEALCAGHSSSAIIIVVCIAIAIGVLGICGYVLYRRKKKGKHMNFEGESEKVEETQNNTLYAQVGFNPSAPRKPKRSGGNGAVNNENPMTIYATVQPQSQAAMQTDDEKMCKGNTTSPHQKEKQINCTDEMPPGTQTLPML
ncbi:T-lymphocyte surface antigen Ly-9-like isoform X2 [Alligator sinensis]|uniref:T-lymphocyte surface antigen Ly-9-like isoform X2 n=1 Tax=Alligator sinensis TaxID=38654 RepID=A0A1U7SQL6_ALLSI|nr:T-lymphocyte surface antigen Ly-9-like isoform X2 [Alligator sinensis]